MLLRSQSGTMTAREVRTSACADGDLRQTLLVVATSRASVYRLVDPSLSGRAEHVSVRYVCANQICSPAESNRPLFPQTGMSVELHAANLVVFARRCAGERLYTGDSG